MATARQFPNVRRVETSLRGQYKLNRLGNKANPLDELGFVLLTEGTPESKHQEVYDSFKARFPRWADVPDASLAELATVISVGGNARQKARNLRAFTRKLRRDHGRVSLAMLEEMSTEKAEEFLCALPGVGRWAARCVLMYALDRPVFPADRHCLRVMSRLGWVDCRGISPRQIVENVQRGDRIAAYIADTAQAGVPAESRHALHVCLVQHGQTICRLRPNCEACVLNKLCPRIGVTEQDNSPAASV